MQSLGFVLFQLNEACRHIKDGRLAQLRLALLLLDNAAEIQMNGCVSHHLIYEEMQERLRSQVFQVPEESRTKDLQDLLEWKPLSAKQKRAVAWSFDEKVRFLSERANQLGAHLTGPLSYLHRYRNEAYHHATVRKATIETAAKLLLDINCELLLSLSRDGTSYASDEDYSWLEERFGRDSVGILHNENLVSNAVKEFRTDTEIDDQSIGQLLANHLHSRFQDVFDALEFVVQNTKCPDRETAIRESHDFAKARREKSGLSTRDQEDVETRYSLEFLDKLIARLPKIKEISDRFEAFRRFSEVESEFEPVEQNIQELAANVDGRMQMQSDIARGK